ncbi:hypothetical protein EUTSA_v10005554mg [Eutrema salsugineum]|uniref:Neprosin domain-containing protein n=1 Tax=Eutrema salsugineum TaxID=72664 RepID=V4KLH7_EUTSA|nr:hypothetical protein EUTSA_v10005554mg [Eutrema salsugineum]
MYLCPNRISENVTYDCIDIYKQPGLDHPLLKTHNIQNQTGNIKTSNKKKIGPDGTGPTLRYTKEFITNPQIFAEKYFHPLSDVSPGTHIAGVRSRNGPFHGVEAFFNGYTLNVGKDQASYI